MKTVVFTLCSNNYLAHAKTLGDSIREMCHETDFIIGHHTTILPTAEYKNHTIRLLEVNYDKKQNFSEEKHCSIKLRID